MKVIHWTACLGSGLEATARAMSRAELALGIDSRVCDPFLESSWDIAEDGDVHVNHCHFPPKVTQRLRRRPRMVWVGHGTPEYTFQKSVAEGSRGGYGFGDSFMLMQHWLRTADAHVTFWPRHQAIYRTMVGPRTPIDLVPMGVDRSFWAPGESRGKWGGSPSVFTAENPHQGKWPLDLFLLWPWVAEAIDEATLHASYVAQDQHRWWFPLVNSNGTAFRTHLSSIKWGKDDLRNAFRSIDFFIGLVRYGDHNQLSHEANASGATTISYRGNVYADFWLPEGDQRDMAAGLISILRGEAEPRAKEPVPDISDTAKAMLSIYERVA